MRGMKSKFTKTNSPQKFKRGGRASGAPILDLPLFIKVEILWFKDSVIKGKMVFKFMSKVYDRETTDPRSEDAGNRGEEVMSHTTTPNHPLDLQVERLNNY